MKHQPALWILILLRINHCGRASSGTELTLLPFPDAFENLGFEVVRSYETDALSERSGKPFSQA